MRGDRGASTRWVLLLALLVLSAGAATTLEDPGDSAGHIVVGDLKLADDDEGPSDGVSGTFTAGNLAPGEASRGRLMLLREPFADPFPPAREPRVRFAVDLAEGSTLASVLEVVELRYGERDLRDRMERACGAPLVLEVLDRCTDRQRHPLSDLPDPTLQGRDLVLATQLDPDATNEHQGATARFTITATLKARPLETHAPDARLPQAPVVTSGCTEHPDGQAVPALGLALTEEPAPGTSPSVSPADGRAPELVPNAPGSSRRTRC